MWLIVSGLKNALGEFWIPAEICKTWLPSRLIWKAKEYPSDWNTSVLLSLPREWKNFAEATKATICQSWSQKFALSFCRVASLHRDTHIRRNSVAFRPDNGYVDQIFLFRKILAYRHKSQHSSAPYFIDFRAVLDSTDHEIVDGNASRWCSIQTSPSD